MFTRNCPKCNKILNYKLKGDRDFADRHKSSCMSCALTKTTVTSLIRNCPGCNKEMIYSGKNEYLRAVKTNTRCKSCRNRGENNPSFGKRHTPEHRRKISESCKKTLGIQNRDFNPDIVKGQLMAWATRNKKRHPYCEKCGSTKNLECHHLLFRSEFPEYAFEDWNSQVLCRSCHKDYHREFGYSTPVEAIKLCLPTFLNSEGKIEIEAT